MDLHSRVRPHGRCPAPQRKPQRGFTLVELVLVLVMLGALAVFAAPAMLDLGAWRQRAFADTLQAEAMTMQRRALTQRQPITATVSPTGVSFTNAAGDVLASLACPASASPCIVESTTRSATFNAGGSGRTTTSTGSHVAITVGTGGLQRRLHIESQTGLIRALP